VAFGVVAIASTFLPLFSADGIQHLAALRVRNPFEFWAAPAIRIAAGVAGMSMLHGFNWGRWLLVIWFAYHVILSIFHSPFELVVHILISVVVLYILFRRPAAVYFSGAEAGVRAKAS
jgi:hypothetical protein